MSSRKRPRGDKASNEPRGPRGEKVSLADQELKVLPKRDFSRATTVSVSKNRLSAKALASGLRDAKELRVLQAANNLLKKLPDFGIWPQLGALILNDNAIKRIPTLPALPSLNTLVLSRNRIQLIAPDAFHALSGLVKLSLSHNRISAFPDVTKNKGLVELRLNSNQITVVPDELALNRHALRLVDVGNNALPTWAALGPLGAMGLHNITLRGNPFVGDDPGAYRDKVLQLFDGIRVADGSVVGRTAQRLERRKARVAAKKKAGIPLGVPAPGLVEAQQMDAEEAAAAAAAAGAEDSAKEARENAADAAAARRLLKQQGSGVVAIVDERKKKQQREADAGPEFVDDPGADVDWDGEEDDGEADKRETKKRRKKKKKKKDQDARRAEGATKSTGPVADGAEAEAEAVVESAPAAPAQGFDPAAIAKTDAAEGLGGGFGGGW